MRSTTWFKFLIALFTLLLVGCSVSTTQPILTPSLEPAHTTEVEPISTPSDEPDIFSTPTIPLTKEIPTLLITGEPATGFMTEDEAIELATKELTEELGIDPGQIEVRAFFRMNWSNTSLGCPKKGMVYAQVIVPGYRVILRVNDQEYTVHVGDSRAVICTLSEGSSVNPGDDPIAFSLPTDFSRRRPLDLEISSRTIPIAPPDW
jgi:hypothetical protein